jgi:hypothetical protein
VGAAWLATQTVLAGVLLPRLVRLARAGRASGVPSPAVGAAASLDRPGTAHDRSTSDHP